MGSRLPVILLPTFRPALFQIGKHCFGARRVCTGFLMHREQEIHSQTPRKTCVYGRCPSYHEYIPIINLGLADLFLFLHLRTDAVRFSTDWQSLFCPVGFEPLWEGKPAVRYANPCALLQSLPFTRVAGRGTVRRLQWMRS